MKIEKIRKITGWMFLIFSLLTIVNQCILNQMDNLTKYRLTKSIAGRLFYQYTGAVEILGYFSLLAYFILKAHTEKSSGKRIISIIMAVLIFLFGCGCILLVKFLSGIPS